MPKIKAFSFTYKDSISISGVGIRIITKNESQSYKLFRQFDEREKELLCEFNLDIPSNKVIKFDIHKRNRDIFSLLKKVRSKVKNIYGDREDLFEIVQDPNYSSAPFLKIWHEHFNSEEFILDRYCGHMFKDKAKTIWIYDIVPAIKEFVQIDNNDLLPLPGTNLIYSLEDPESGEEIYSKKLLIPELLPNKLELFNIFEQDKNLYHLELYWNDRVIWSKFTSNTSKRRTKFIQETKILKRDFISEIKPDLTTFPDIKPTSSLFIINDKPPTLSNLELMETKVKITKIRTDIFDPNNFSSLSFESRFFNTSNFPRTFSFIYPHF